MDLDLWLGRIDHQVDVAFICGGSRVFPCFSSLMLSPAGDLKHKNFPWEHTELFPWIFPSLKAFCLIIPNQTSQSALPTQPFRRSVARVTRSHGLVSFCCGTVMFPTFKFARSDLALSRRSQNGVPKPRVSVSSCSPPEEEFIQKQRKQKLKGMSRGE